VWCGVGWCGVVWCGVVWCGVVWCGVVWCGVVWCELRFLISTLPAYFLYLYYLKCALLAMTAYSFRPQ
jgi:hypothetical protein